MKLIWHTKAMRRIALPALFLLCALAPAWGQEPAPAYLLQVDGAIGPATTHYLTEGIEAATAAGAPVIVIRMNTPGGLDAAMRDIIQAILASPVPVATFVAPKGARAASAGTYILYASHVAAMAPATNLGAATPVQIGGGAPQSPEREAPVDTDSGEQDSAPAEPAGGSAMHRKMVNDAAAYIRGLAELRGRNADWAEQAVREAVSLSAQAALEANVIDLMAGSVTELLAKMDGLTVTVQGAPHTIHSAAAAVKTIEPDWRTELLAVITNPTVAYILMMIGIYGLILEGYNPGAIVPGVVGAICLLLALFAFQVLPVNYAGLALIALGVILMVAELFAPSFGALGLGGLVALVFGSIILMDTDVPGFGISPWVIGATAAISGLMFMTILGLALRAYGRPVVSGRDQMVGLQGTVLEDFHGQGRVHVHGEIWRALSKEALKKGDQVTITGVDGLTLTVTSNHQSRT